MSIYDSATGYVDPLYGVYFHENEELCHQMKQRGSTDLFLIVLGATMEICGTDE